MDNPVPSVRPRYVAYTTPDHTVFTEIDNEGEILEHFASEGKDPKTYTRIEFDTLIELAGRYQYHSK